MRGVAAPPALQVRLGRELPRSPVLGLIPARVIGGQAETASGERPTVTDLVAADVVLRILPGTGNQARGSAVAAVPLRVPRP